MVLGRPFLYQVLIVTQLDSRKKSHRAVGGGHSSFPTEKQQDKGPGPKKHLRTFGVGTSKVVGGPFYPPSSVVQEPLKFIPMLILFWCTKEGTSKTKRPTQPPFQLCVASLGAPRPPQSFPLKGTPLGALGQVSKSGDNPLPKFRSAHTHTETKSQF